GRKRASVPSSISLLIHIRDIQANGTRISTHLPQIVIPLEIGGHEHHSHSTTLLGGVMYFRTPPLGNTSRSDNSAKRNLSPFASNFLQQLYFLHSWQKWLSPSLGEHILGYLKIVLGLPKVRLLG